MLKEKCHRCGKLTNGTEMINARDLPLCLNCRYRNGGKPQSRLDDPVWTLIRQIGYCDGKKLMDAEEMETG
jgi:DNA-directed RNA polymerase subunit RPC12/RpoP